MSRRSDIAAAIYDRLRQLTSFVTVERWRDTGSEPFDITDVPALNIKDGNGDIVHQVSQDEHALVVKIDIVTVKDISAVIVEDLLNAVVASIGSDESWGNLADGTNVDSHDIDLTAEAADTVSSGQIKLTVNYTTEKGQI
jgi:hypothetical protein